MKAFLRAFVFVFTLALLFTQCEKEPDPNDPVNIPDKAFLEALIELGVDNNGDGKISYGEAESTTKLNFQGDPWSFGISDMTGIEAFINLDTLNTGNNGEIIELDVSKNTKLAHLECRNNDLMELDVSKNTKLKYLDCSGIDCWCEHPGGILKILDITNNTSLKYLRCSMQKEITEICVWVMPFPPEGVEIDTTLSPNVYFTTDCSQ